MAELLLRGAQTVGELRGRAARMEPIADLTALKPVLDTLIQKGLVIPLSPEGRGQVVAHGLYQPHELERVRAELGTRSGPSEADGGETPRARAPAHSGSGIEELRSEITRLREEFHALRAEFEQLRATLS
jgi:uncharacterized protein YceH (UPF0502 family)